MHWKSDNIEIKIRDEADEVIKKLFDSLLSRSQKLSAFLRGKTLCWFVLSRLLLFM